MTTDKCGVVFKEDACKDHNLLAALAEALLLYSKAVKEGVGETNDVRLADAKVETVLQMIKQRQSATRRHWDTARDAPPPKEKQTIVAAEVGNLEDVLGVDYAE